MIFIGKRRRPDTLEKEILSGCRSNTRQFQPNSIVDIPDLCRTRDRQLPRLMSARINLQTN